MSCLAIPHCLCVHTRFPQPDFNSHTSAPTQCTSPTHVEKCHAAYTYIPCHSAQGGLLCSNKILARVNLAYCGLESINVKLFSASQKQTGTGAGGEGATAREVLRHKSVEEVVMVDIDKVHIAQNALHFLLCNHILPVDTAFSASLLVLQHDSHCSNPNHVCVATVVAWLVYTSVYGLPDTETTPVSTLLV